MDKRSCVLVTGAGGVATPSMIRDLKGAGHRVVACDMDSYAAGFWEADAGYVIPAGGSPAFPEAMRRVCMADGVQVVIPLVDEELLPCWDAGLPCQILAPRREFVELCLRKDLLMAALRNISVPVPITMPFDGALEPCYPAIIKPCTGRGSRGVVRVEHRGELFTRLIDRSLSYSADWITQERIIGTEYTVSVVAWRNGDTQAVVPKEIICKRGITKQAVTRAVTAIAEVCIRIQERLRADGPFNVQLILDERGKPWIFEINPRYSTTTTLTAAAGCPEVAGLVAMALGGEWPGRGGTFQESLVLVRGAHDRFISLREYVSKKPSHA